MLYTFCVHTATCSLYAAYGIFFAHTTDIHKIDRKTDVHTYTAVQDMPF